MDTFPADNPYLQQTISTAEVESLDHFSDEIKAFEPSIEEEFLTIQKTGQYQRLIFMNVELRDKEESQLEAFREHCQENNITIPDGYDDDTRFLLRILQGKKWKYDITAQELLAHSEWKKATYPLQYDPVKEILAQGIIYGYKRDNSMRPIIIIQSDLIIKNADKIDQIVAATTYFLDHVTTKAMIPGKIESWIAIFDLNNVGTTQISNKNLQQVVKVMQRSYPGRLYKFFGIEVSMVFRAMWALAHKMVDDFTKQKMSVHGDKSDYGKEILKYVPAENLQKKYGGTADDVTQFWPPVFK